jgi:hypothetical protein
VCRASAYLRMVGPARRGGVSDDVLAKLPEVVAHQYEQLPLKARLLILLLGNTAAVEKIRSASRGA